jgi:hypothetical protein
MRGRITTHQRRSIRNPSRSGTFGCSALEQLLEPLYDNEEGPDWTVQSEQLDPIREANIFTEVDRPHRLVSGECDGRR